MPVNLSKGANISLEKAAPGMTTAIVGLGWNPRTTDGAQFDLDASVLLLGENGKVRSQADFVFYNNLTGDNGSVQHLGDNRTGEGEGDDEQIKVSLGQVSPDVQRYAVSVTAATRRSDELMLGASPRATLHLVRAAKAAAAIDGRDYVLPDDVLRLSAPVLAHRLLPSVEAAMSGRSTTAILDAVLTNVPVPSGAR